MHPPPSRGVSRSTSLNYYAQVWRMNHTYNPYSHLFANWLLLLYVAELWLLLLLLLAAGVCHFLKKSCALNFNKLIFAFFFSLPSKGDSLLWLFFWYSCIYTQTYICRSNMSGYKSNRKDNQASLRWSIKDTEPLMNALGQNFNWRIHISI